MRWPQLFTRNTQRPNNYAPLGTGLPTSPRFLSDPKTPIQQIGFISLTDFISVKPCAVLLLYADWEPYGRFIRPIFFTAAQQFTDMEFGQVSLDEHSQSLFAELAIMNVPAVAFFAGGELQNVVYGVEAILAELKRLE